MGHQASTRTCEICLRSLAGGGLALGAVRGSGVCPRWPDAFVPGFRGWTLGGAGAGGGGKVPPLVFVTSVTITETSQRHCSDRRVNSPQEI